MQSLLCDNKLVAVLSADNNNEGNICNYSCPTLKGLNQKIIFILIFFSKVVDSNNICDSCDSTCTPG